jgi:HTH-type transcriptional regulator/antitoxin HigA
MIGINGKMTRTFNTEFYGKLLAEHQPKTINTEEENEQAIALAQDLEYRPNRTPEEDMLLELLVTLIEKFEETYYPIPKGTSHSMLKHLMDARSLTPEALAGVVGSLEVVQEMINGSHTINKAEAEALADYFHVDAGLFARNYFP